LPGFHAQLQSLTAARPGVDAHDEAVLRLHRAARLAYVGILSPAAFIAIASGIFLIFQRGVVAPWFSLKLALVTGLVIAHSLAGLTLVRQFERLGHYPTWRYLAATSAALLIAGAIITLTLGKPALTTALLPAGLSEPGALAKIFAPFNPWQRP
jgi:putative membrane protein